MKKYALAALLLLVGCGSDSATEPSTTTTTVLQTTTTSSTTTSTSTTSTSTTTTTTLPTPGYQASEVRGRCTQYEGMLAQYAPERGWNVEKMSQIMWRESRCVPELYSKTSDSGLLQINRVNWDDLSKHFGIHVTKETLYDPKINIQSAAVLCEVWDRHGYSCYHPWGG